jgi:hypothetical protein
MDHKLLLGTSLLHGAFGVVDFFTAGLGFELAAGLLLAKSAMVRASVIAREEIIGPAIDEVISPPPGHLPTSQDRAVMRRARQAVEAALGYGMLAAGFFVGLVGYLLSTSPAVKVATSGDHWGRGVVAALIGIVVAAALAWAGVRIAARLTREMVGYAVRRTGFLGDSGQGFANLFRCARLFDEPRNNEGNEAFTRRMFHVPEGWIWPNTGEIPWADPEPGIPADVAKIVTWLDQEAAEADGAGRPGASVEASVYRRLRATLQTRRFESAEQFFLHLDEEHVREGATASDGVTANEAGGRALAAARSYADLVRGGRE